MIGARVAVAAASVGASGVPAAVFVEVGLAVTMLASRFVRVAAIVGMAQSVAICLAVANAPNEWYLIRVLMVAPRLAVLVEAPAMHPIRARTSP